MSPPNKASSALLFRMDTSGPASTTMTSLQTMTTGIFTSIQTSISHTAETASVTPTAINFSMMSMVTVSPVASSTITQPQNPSLQSNTTSFGAIQPAKNDSPPVIVIVIVLIISLIMLVAITLLIHARSRKACANKHRIDEEGRLEVLEARAIMPGDETLKRAYSPSLLYGGDEKEMEVARPLAIITKIQTSDNELIPHPLFHPSLKRSRTMSYDRTHPRTPRTPVTPYAMASRTPRIDLPASPLSPRSPYESKPMSPYTTMQTRRPKTPSIQIPPRERSSEPVTDHSIRPVKSVWSSPTASCAPSSPSTYSEVPFKAETNSLRPPPSRDLSVLAATSLPQPAQEIIHSPNCPLAALVDDFLAQTHSQTPAVVTGLKANRASTPISPQEPRSYSPAHASLLAPSIIYIAEPEPVFSPPSRRPSLAELNAMSDSSSLECPLGLERVDDEVKIERWLEGSTGTTSAFGSVVDLRVDVTDRGRKMSVGGTKTGIDPRTEQRRGSVKLSPIRDMRPSWARRGSGQREGAGEESNAGNAK